jgi:hypothetical protein
MNCQLPKKRSAPFSYFKFSGHVFGVGYVVYAPELLLAVVKSLVKRLLLY